MNNTIQIIAVIIVVLILGGCTSEKQNNEEIQDSAKSKIIQIEAPKKLMLATTTSTYDTGLLDYIIPEFEKKYNYDVQIISVGTGQALKNGQDGNVDVVLVHAPASERKFVNDGYGINRKCVMYNDFIIVGPESDPAKIKGLSAANALSVIVGKKSTFISRGDNSGTYTKELDLWKKANISTVNQSWHLETGLGMGDTMRVANEKQTYTLSDRATYVSMKINNTGLVILVEGDKDLLNPYGVIMVNPAKNPKVNTVGARDFEDWIMSNETQDLIGSYQKGGEQLFYPLRGACVVGQ